MCVCVFIIVIYNLIFFKEFPNFSMDKNLEMIHGFFSPLDDILTQKATRIQTKKFLFIHCT